MGGAHGLNYLIGLVRVKAIAILLGPSGVGLISLYTAAIGMVGAVSSLGIGTSGVREVAQAHGHVDPANAARTTAILRRTCWATGLLGWGLAVALAHPLSLWMFRSPDHAVALAVLGFTLLLGAVTGGQAAILQGGRRIGDIARLNVASALVNTAMAIGIYAAMGERGIVPVMLTAAAVSLVSSWWFVRRIDIESVSVSWTEALLGARRLAGLGIAIMWSGLLTTGLDMATRSMIAREYGINAVGHYQAAWALSGMFAGFVLNAMGTDFYPRLCGVINDHSNAVRMVNEQTEVGMMLALPGLLATLAFAPLAIELFFSKDFLLGADLVPWFLVGILGRVVSWPMGYILLAKGASRWFAATETAFLCFQMVLVLWFVPRFGAIGAAYAFAITYFVVTVVMLWICFALIGFRWSANAKLLLGVSGAFVLAGIGVRMAMPGWEGTVGGGAVVLAGTVVSCRRLSVMLGSDHALVRTIRRLPGGRWIANLDR